MKNNDIAPRTLAVSVPVSERDIWGLLVSAFEGGSNYWIRNVAVKGEWPAKARDTAQVPLAGGALRFEVFYEDVVPRRDLDREAIERGLALLAKAHPEHFANLIKKAGDAVTGDVLPQLCLFDEVVFG